MPNKPAVRQIALGALVAITTLMAFQNCGKAEFTYRKLSSDGNNSQNCVGANCPQPPPPGACVFNGVTIPEGQSVIAYLLSNVATGEVCLQETRTCINGTLTGTYAHGTCTVGPPPNTPCMFNGVMVPPGVGVIAYKDPSVPAGQQCVFEIRICNNGVLSGTFTHPSCSSGDMCPPDGKKHCTFNGKPVAHGSYVKAYKYDQVKKGSECKYEKRYCDNGKLSGSYQHASCSEKHR